MINMIGNDAYLGKEMIPMTKKETSELVLSSEIDFEQIEIDLILSENAREKEEDSRIAQLPSKSAKIRALAKKGVSRANIAKILGIRYQFVRNVLISQK